MRSPYRRTHIVPTRVPKTIKYHMNASDVSNSRFFFNYASRSDAFFLWFAKFISCNRAIDVHTERVRVAWRGEVFRKSAVVERCDWKMHSKWGACIHLHSIPGLETHSFANMTGIPLINYIYKLNKNKKNVPRVLWQLNCMVKSARVHLTI